MRQLCIASILLLLFAGSVLARDSRPGDFAYGITLQTAGTEALYQFSLPDVVYRSVTRSDLGDLCIFNRLGEVVPFTLSHITAPSPAIPERRKLTLFPVSGSRLQEPGNVSLLVKKGDGGSLVSVQTAEPGTRSSRITAYLLDAATVKAPLRDLILEWAEQPEGTVTKIRIEGSDNLEDWTLLAPSAVLIDLRYGNHRLERRIIDLNGSMMKYYRISSAAETDLPKFTSAAVHLSPAAAELPRHWTRVTAAARSNRTGDYLFTTSGLMPIDRVRVQLPQENTLIQASFFSRATEKDPWKQGPSVLLYRLSIRGETLTSPDVVLPVSSDRYRLLRIDQAGGGIGNGLPLVELGWLPARILFLARGGGPFQLAFGSGRPGTCARGDNTLFRQFYDQHKERYIAGTALAGAPVPLAGKAALRKPFLPYDTKTIVLWSLLFLGVATLAWMALHLHRQINITKKGNEK
ncbi:MAG: DUF3999 domain-containing protein [Deltaproteobacteria bacterium]|nr:DUF3999 domain-containing protein [Deltaproteobacteria bacterium]TLN05204.1 MAG: DUF3999 domain-containing protein [bacterium]